MKNFNKIVLLFFLLANFISAISLAGVVQRAPSYVCGRLNNEYAASCYKIIKGATFDRWAAGECDSYNHQDATIACMKIIKNKKFAQSAVFACDRIKTEEGTSRCLNVIANKQYRSAEVKKCDALSDVDDTVACFKTHGTISLPDSAPSNHLIWDAQTKTCNMTSPKGEIIEHKTPNDCIADSSTQYAWDDSSMQQCGAYSIARDLIDYVNIDKCTKSNLIYLKSSNLIVSASTATINGTPYYLVPEILNLQNGDTVPQEIYKKYSPNLIAASLVQRLHNTKETKANSENPNYDFQAHTLLQLKFNDKYVNSIKQSCFLNQHQVNHSDGLLNQNRRANIEDSLIGIDLENSYKGGTSNLVNTVRPKYGFLGFEKDTNGQQRNRFSRQYGNIVAVLKNEVKDRTTFTQVDSLDGNMNSDGDVVYGNIQAYSFKYRSRSVLPRIKDPVADEDYWEVQVWGTLCMSDVDYFLINCPGDNKVSQNSLTTLKSIGLPVYKCEFVSDRSHFEKGKLIFAGDATKKIQPPQQTGTETHQFIKSDTPTPAGFVPAASPVSSSSAADAVR